MHKIARKYRAQLKLLQYNNTIYIHKKQSWFRKNTRHENSNRLIRYVFSVTVRSGTSGPLGLADDTIEDDQMTASSQYSDLKAYKGRLRKTGRNFWASSTGDLDSPWLQVDFLKPVVITGIQTQGAGTIAQYATQVQIQYGNDVSALQTILENGSPKVTRLCSCWEGSRGINHCI